MKETKWSNRKCVAFILLMIFLTWGAIISAAAQSGSFTEPIDSKITLQGEVLKVRHGDHFWMEKVEEIEEISEEGKRKITLTTSAGKWTLIVFRNRMERAVYEGAVGDVVHYYNKWEGA